MANSSHRKKKYSIGKDGKIIVTDIEDDKTEDDKTDDDRTYPRLLLLIPILLLVIIIELIVLGGNKKTVDPDAALELNGTWVVMGHGGRVHHVIANGTDSVYNTYAAGEGQSLEVSPMAVETVSPLGEFDARDFGSDGKGQAFKIGQITYLLYDSDPDTLVCRNLDGSGYSETNSLSRISAETDAPHVDSPTTTNIINAKSGDVITVEGTLRRIEQTKAQTGMGWSRVVYLIELDSGTIISYTDGNGDVTRHQMDSIAVDTLEQYGDDADKDLGSVTSSHWQQYVGKHISASGRLHNTGNAHTYGFAMLDVYGVRPFT